MIILEPHPTPWTDTTVRCTVCKSIIKFENTDRPRYSSCESIQIAVGENWRFEWECPNCHQELPQKIFIRYKH